MSKLFKKKNNKDEHVTVFWDDAVIYKVGTSAKKCDDIVTSGILIKDEKDYIVLRNPKTYILERGKRIFQESSDGATFYFIPKGVIKRQI